jgi:hypothetical protein
MLPQTSLANPGLRRPKGQTKLKCRTHLEVCDKVLPSTSPLACGIVALLTLFLFICFLTLALLLSLFAIL